MVAPGQWRDDGPQSAHLTIRSYASVRVETVGSMRPVLSPGGNAIGYVADGTGSKLTIVRPPKPRPVCGVIMRNLREPCARTAGHASGKGGGHRTAASMAEAAIMRRTNTRGLGS